MTYTIAGEPISAAAFWLAFLAMLGLGVVTFFLGMAWAERDK